MNLFSGSDFTSHELFSGLHEFFSDFSGGNSPHSHLPTYSSNAKHDWRSHSAANIGAGRDPVENSPTSSDPISGKIVSPFSHILSPPLIEFLAEVLFIFIVYSSLFDAVYSVLFGGSAVRYLNFMAVEMVL